MIPRNASNIGEYGPYRPRLLTRRLVVRFHPPQWGEGIVLQGLMALWGFSRENDLGQEPLGSNNRRQLRLQNLQRDLTLVLDGVGQIEPWPCRPHRAPLGRSGRAHIAIAVGLMPSP